MGRLRVSVLGVPRVEFDGQEHTVRGRPLLIVLRLAAAGGVPVPGTRLRRDVWGDADVGEGTVRVNLTRVRQGLGREVVTTSDMGYSLTGCSSDATEFERLVGQARRPSTPIDRRVRLYGDALGLWRSQAYETVEELDWVVRERTRLGELREDAVDEQVELRLVLDDACLVVPDLSVAHESHPLRERRTALLATALYRAGRQTDALDLLRRSRAELRDHLGLDPGPELRELEHRILVHDESLLRAAHDVSTNVGIGVAGEIRVAESLTRAGATTEALAILDRAERRAGADGRTCAAWSLARARALLMSGEGDPEPFVRRAQQLARALDDGELLADCAVMRFSRGASPTFHDAILELMEPVDLLAPDASQRVDLLCAAAITVMLASGSDAAELLLVAAGELHQHRPTVRSGAVLAAARSVLGSARRDPPADVEAEAWRALELARAAANGSTDDGALVLVVACHALLRALYRRCDVDGVDAVLTTLDGSARRAALPFAVVRVALCRAVNAYARGDLDRAARYADLAMSHGDRFGTLNTATIVVAQRAQIDRERMADHRDVADLRRRARPGEDHWYVFEAFCRLVGDGGPPLLSVVGDAPVGGGLAPFAAVAAEVAGQTGDRMLARWCVPRLDELGDEFIVAGLGSVGFGFAPYFAGVARLVVGDVDGAIERFERGIEVAARVGATLFEHHAVLGLATALMRRGSPDDVERAAPYARRAVRSGTPRVRAAARRLDLGASAGA